MKAVTYKITDEEKEKMRIEAKKLGLNLSALSRYAVIKFLKGELV